MSGIINKVKDALHSDKTHEAPEGTHGTHNSKVANAADPRIDSDRDHRANPATGTGVTGHNTTTGHTGGLTGSAGHNTSGHTGGLTGTTGHNTTGTHSNVTGYDDPTGTHGPHGSKIANAADPRVDSDRDHRGAPGSNTGFGTSTGAGHSTGLGSSTGHTGGLTGTTGHNTTGHSNVTGYDDPTGTHGTHNSKIANAADPRIDSDRDHRGAPGSNTTGFGSTGVGHSTTTGHSTGLGSTTGAGHSSNTTTGYNDPTGTHGTHNSKIANAADPRIDSDRDHRGAPGAAGTSHLGSGPGPAPNTAGPHSKDILNKVDPRVDSDLDGSKTVGGNKTLS